MKKRPIKDVAASVRQRLTNKARDARRPFQEVLQYFAMERFLYRLVQSRHADKFILKGALMFNAWGAPSSRPTKDIDLLGRMDSAVEAVVAVMREVCNQRAQPDGLVFHADSVAGSVIKEDADYAGVRVNLLVTLQNARVSMQIDTGFGDVITPEAALTEYPTLLDFPAPQLLCYNRETVVAEKFQAMVYLGQLNTRLKDFYDLWLLAQRFDFDGPVLASAIKRTFANRKTDVTSSPTALTPAFGEDPLKQTQWQGFLRKAKLESAPANLQTVVDAVSLFVCPVARTLESATGFDQRWVAPGPWQPK